MRRLFLFAFCLFTFAAANAQRFYTQHEFGIMAGASQYYGDINDDYGFAYIRPAAGVFYRYLLNPYIDVKASFSYTRLGYSDAQTGNPFNEKRNLDFKTDIGEVALQAEFNFFRFTTGEEKSRFTPYLTGGIGAFYYNPYTTLNGEKVYLRPLGTEGQNTSHKDRSYSNFSACFPVGAGLKYWLASGVNLGFEITDRLTLTDYIDDISTSYAGADQFKPGSNAQLLQDRSSTEGGVTAIGKAGKQRGNSASKDQYMYAVFTLSFQFKTYKCPTYQTENYQFSY